MKIKTLIFLMSIVLLALFFFCQCEEDEESEKNEYREEFIDLQDSCVDWAKSYGYSETDETAFLVRQTDDEGYIMAGEASLSRKEDKVRIWLVKTDFQGNRVWDEVYESDTTLLSEYYRNLSELPLELTEDNGFVLAGCSSSNEVFLIKVNSDGEQVWEKSYRGYLSYDCVYSVKQTSDLGYIMAGFTYFDDAWSYDFLLLKTDSEGELIWQKTFGGPYNEKAYSVSQTEDGGYIVVGETTTFSAGREDIWVVKTDSEGNPVWERKFGGANEEIGLNIAPQLNDGGYGILGSIYIYKEGIYFVKTDREGSLEWSQIFYNRHGDERDISSDQVDSGFILLGGTSTISLLKVNSEGEASWQKDFESPDYLMRGYSMQRTSDKGYVIAGGVSNNPKAIKSNSDFLLVKIKSDCQGDFFTDADDDGHGSEESGGDDCNDTDSTIYPGAVEIGWDGIDQDCDDEDLVCPFYVDINNQEGVEDGSPDHPFSTVQEAVDLATHNLDCRHVIVRPGIYYENINIELGVGSRFIMESSDGPASTVLDGQYVDSVISIDGCSVTIEGFTITGGYGECGGIKISGGFISPYEIEILHNLIISNHATNRGGGICVEYYETVYDVSILNNIIAGNIASWFGGGISLREELTGVVENNILIGNKALQGGGGIFFDNYTKTVVQNNIIAFNSDGFYSYYSYTDPTSMYNLFFENSGGNYLGYAEPGDSEIEADPLFISFLDDSDWTNDDFHLATGSPCVNAGNPEIIYNDPDGSPNDIGAYGGYYGDW